MDCLLGAPFYVNRSVQNFWCLSSFERRQTKEEFQLTFGTGSNHNNNLSFVQKTLSKITSYLCVQYCKTFEASFKYREVLKFSRDRNQRTLTYILRGSMTVRLTSCVTGLDATKLVNLHLIQHKQSSWIKPVKQYFLLQSKWMFSVETIQQCAGAVDCIQWDQMPNTK